MKTKRLNKKLRLEKRTITNLGDQLMAKVNGGAVTDTCTCPLSCVQVCYPDTSPEQCPYTAWRCTYVQKECIPNP